MTNRIQSRIDDIKDVDFEMWATKEFDKKKMCSLPDGTNTNAFGQTFEILWTEADLLVGRRTEQNKA